MHLGVACAFRFLGCNRVLRAEAIPIMGKNLDCLFGFSLDIDRKLVGFNVEDVKLIEMCNQEMKIRMCSR